MKKAKVIREFQDKHTKALYHIGDVINVTDERYAEITKAGRYLFLVAQEGAGADSDASAISSSPEESKPAETASSASGDAFDEMTVAQLKAYADQTYKLTFKGMRKAEIIEELRRMEQGGK